MVAKCKQLSISMSLKLLRSRFQTTGHWTNYSIRQEPTLATGGFCTSAFVAPVGSWTKKSANSYSSSYCLTLLSSITLLSAWGRDFSLHTPGLVQGLPPKRLFHHGSSPLTHFPLVGQVSTDYLSPCFITELSSLLPPPQGSLKGSGK